MNNINNVSVVGSDKKHDLRDNVFQAVILTG